MPNCLTMSSSHHYFAASYQIFMVPSETITHIVILSNSWYSAARVGMDNIVQKEQESKSKTYIWTHFIDPKNLCMPQWEVSALLICLPIYNATS